MIGYNEIVMEADIVFQSSKPRDCMTKLFKYRAAGIREYCKNRILEKNCKIYKQGKNWYCETDHIKITINSYSYTIITAHIKRRNERKDWGNVGI